MKLLNRTVKNYIIYSALLIVVCTPLFYFAIQTLFTHEMDEVLIDHKKDFAAALPYLKTEDDLLNHHRLNQEFHLNAVTILPTTDSLYTCTLYDSIDAQFIPYRTLRTGAIVMEKPYELLIQESMVSNTDLIGAIMTIQIVMLSLLLVGLVIINRNLSKIVWGPFYIILDKLKRYQIDKDASLNLPRSSTAEFRDLSTVITQLVDKNHQAYQNQKEFTENASHELQTPLAICRSKLELLLQTKELTQEQADILSSLYDATDRISRLIKNLLLLSKIENKQFVDTEEIELYSVVLKSLGNFNQQIQKKKVNVVSSLSSSVIIKANPVLIEILVNNLLSNAIRYTPDKGEIKIEILKTALSISNTGLPLDNPEKIFQRFHRESRSSHGSGLGLAIVKEICEAQGYKITYTYSSSMHHFKISFNHQD